MSLTTHPTGSDLRIEDCSAVSPGARKGDVELLARVAQNAPLVALAASGIGAIALALWGLDQIEAALIAAVCAVTLGVVGVVAVLATGHARRRMGAVAAVLVQAYALAPDPALITDSDGRARAANSAAGGCVDPATLLDGWCVDPPAITTALLHEALRTGGIAREFWRYNRGLRISVHIAEMQPPLIVWQFAAIHRGGVRGLDTLGLPVLTRDGDVVTPNAAARDALDGVDGAIEAIVAACDAAMPARSSGVSLAGGYAALALQVQSRDNHTDIFLLPSEPGRLNAAKITSQGHDFDDLPVALVQLDAAGRIGPTNRLARALLGLAAGDERFFWEVVEGLGRPVSDWLEDARVGRALGRPEILRATTTAQETFVQIILRRATGAAGEGALVAVISDATELKSLEARFVQSQKMQAIGQLAGGIAHDFNNLLTAISGHCDLLLLNRDRFDPDYNDLLQIHQNANRAAALVRQLLAFSRKQTLKPEVLTLESLLEDLTHLLTRLVGERITLDLVHDHALGMVRADRRQLEQVIMNLVVNARDAMPMGGTIRIVTEARHLETELEHGRARVPAGDYALIRVIDRGLGIAPDIIDKIFEPFFTTKRVGEGTGLGLSTAYGIVKQMGGYIFCDSVEGTGTEFTLYFAIDSAGMGVESRRRPTSIPPPAATIAVPALVQPGVHPAFDPDARPSGATTALNEAIATPMRGRSILLVEDEAPVRAFAARALRLQGYQVFEAPDGEQALDFLSDPAIHVDLFVTDVIMPGIDGPGWVAQALKDRPQTPVVFVSGYTEDTLSAALVRIPRAVFLGKPFSLRDLSATIAAQIAA